MQRIAVSRGGAEHLQILLGKPYTWICLRCHKAMLCDASKVLAIATILASLAVGSSQLSEASKSATITLCAVLPGLWRGNGSCPKTPVGSSGRWCPLWPGAVRILRELKVGPAPC